jgi:hypothetical protein
VLLFPWKCVFQCWTKYTCADNYLGLHLEAVGGGNTLPWLLSEIWQEAGGFLNVASPLVSHNDVGEVLKGVWKDGNKSYMDLPKRTNITKWHIA